MPPRAVWKGSLKVGDLACPVALYTAVSASDRIAFHTINRKTGHRVHRQYVDAETGAPVAAADQVKGYDDGSGRSVILEPDEIAEAVPDGDKTLAVQGFVECTAIDTLYFDRPYFLTSAGSEAFAVICQGLKSRKVAALATALLFRRVRTVLIRVQDDAVVATLLKFDYEVRSADHAFETVPKVAIKDEMIDLATHIIKTKLGRFDPKTFEDRYEEAVAEVVRAKIEGRPLKAKTAPPATTTSDLMEALRESAKASGRPGRAVAKARQRKPAAASAAARAQPRRRAG